MSFKAGDRVRCVDASYAILVEGKEYTVERYDEEDPFIYLVDDDSGGWRPDRFKLVDRPGSYDLGTGAGSYDGEGSPNLKDTNPKDGAATSRLDLSLIPSTALAYMALAFTEGHLKYGAYNWRDAGVLASVYVAAAQRHLFKWFNGEECDPDTNVPHLASAMACLAVLADASEIGELKDDRPPAMELGELLKDFEGRVKALQQKFSNGPKRHTEAAR